MRVSKVDLFDFCPFDSVTKKVLSPAVKYNFLVGYLKKYNVRDVHNLHDCEIIGLIIPTRLNDLILDCIILFRTNCMYNKRG